MYYREELSRQPNPSTRKTETNNKKSLFLLLLVENCETSLTQKGHGPRSLVLRLIDS